MPNHCENDLYIRGTDADVAAVLALIGADKPEPEFDFDAVIPYPEPFRSMDEEAKAFAWNVPDSVAKSAARDAYIAKYGHERDGFNSGGYEWRCNRWGTKWGAYDVRRRDNGCVCVSYRTAWGPSKTIVVALAERFPQVTFHLEYFEMGQAFCGGFTCPSEDDYYSGTAVPWRAGLVNSEWESEYNGHRGG